MIQQFALTQQGSADAIPAPKHVWMDVNRIVVLTGADMPLLEDPKAIIDQQRNAKLLLGVTWDGDQWYTDGDFQVQITALLSAFSNGIIPSGATVPVRTKGTVVRQLSLLQLKGLAGTLLQYVQSVYAWSWAQKDAL